MKITTGRLKEIIKEEVEMMSTSEEPAPDMFGEPDYEGGMARNELFKVGKYANDLRDMISEEDQLPAWVQSKITKCAAMIGDVKHFIEGELADKSGDSSVEGAIESEEEVRPEELDELVAQELQEVFSQISLNEKKKKVNPWAVCTTSTGQKSGKKRERCIMKIKKKQGMH